MERKLPEPVVGCFILNDKNEVLLCRSFKWPDKWVVCGGHIEWGETIASAVERETLEEVGLKVRFTSVLEVVEFIFHPDFHLQKHLVALQCACRTVGNDVPKLDGREIQEAKWFPLKEAVELPNLLPETRETIRKMIAGN